MRLRQVGISPKVLHPAIVGLLTAALLKFGVSLDPVFEQFLNVAVMIVVGFMAPPGQVVEDTGENVGEVGQAERVILWVLAAILVLVFVVVALRIVD